jgi:hypothetical protein
MEQSGYNSAQHPESALTNGHCEDTGDEEEPNRPGHETPSSGIVPLQHDIFDKQKDCNSEPSCHGGRYNETCPNSCYALTSFPAPGWGAKATNGNCRAGIVLARYSSLIHLAGFPPTTDTQDGRHNRIGCGHRPRHIRSEREPY